MWGEIFMNSNSENPGVGKRFEEKVCEWAKGEFKQNFDKQEAIKIGNPAKPHRFDLVSQDKNIIIECKCYTWTDSGNVPSAKMATLDEAVLYFKCLENQSATKIIAMKYAWSEKKQMTFAEYYCERKGHLLDDVQVWELDENGNNANRVR